MSNFNGQLPPDIPVDVVVPQTTEVAKPAFDKRNYLDFSIPKGQTSREIWIRLLPVNPQTQELFQIIKLHSIAVHKDLGPNKSGKKSYVCLKHNDSIDHATYGSKCPICEEQKRLWDQWHNETDADKKKELAKAAGSLETRDYCIVRCIERGKEEDGPKFWRIPLRQDQTDAYHAIINLGETRRKEGQEAGMDLNIFSIYNGRDLKVTFTEGTGAPTIMDKSISTPLTTDQELLVKWYYDEKKWTDVFGTKTYEYLKIAYEGEVPWFDKVNNKWVYKTDVDNVRTAEEAAQNAAIAQAEAMFRTESVAAPVTQVAPQPSIQTMEMPMDVGVSFPTEDDDLPF